MTNFPMKQHNIISRINLESYSSSKGFLGYTECTCPFSEKNVHDAIERFNKAFQGGLSNLMILSSLYVDRPEYKSICEFNFDTKGVRKSIDTLIDIGILRLVDFDEIFKTHKNMENHDRWYESWIKNLELHNNKDKTILNAVFYAAMALEGVDGHCFVFLPEKELLVYPHDDTGFGFISCRDSQDDNLIEHIRKHFDSDPFQVCAWHDGKPDKKSL